MTLGDGATANVHRSRDYHLRNVIARSFEGCRCEAERNHQKLSGNVDVASKELIGYVS